MKRPLMDTDDVDDYFLLVVHLLFTLLISLSFAIFLLVLCVFSRFRLIDCLFALQLNLYTLVCVLYKLTIMKLSRFCGCLRVFC
jgi:hypothetical protein